MPLTNFDEDFLLTAFNSGAPDNKSKKKDPPIPVFKSERLVQHTPLEGEELASLLTQPSLSVDTGDADSLTNTHFAQWLPFAAKAYHISANVKDYVFRPVPIFITDLPNRNGVGFPAREMAQWSIDGGCQTYQTWRGKPMHIEHQSDDPTKAIGVIVDVSMVPLKGFGQNKLWKVICLAALDRTKDPERVSRIERGELNTYSMGSLVSAYSCSYCGKEVGEGPDFCTHIDPEEQVVFYELKGKLVYRLVRDVMAVELSSVDDPAFGVAASDYDRIRL